MALCILKFFTWFNNHWNTLHCRLNGHTDVVIIEPYKTTHYLKNYIVVGNKIIYGPPFPVTQIKGKLKCKNCNTVYIGIIVKVDNNHVQCQ